MRGSLTIVMDINTVVDLCMQFGNLSHGTLDLQS